MILSQKGFMRSSADIKVSWRFLAWLTFQRFEKMGFLKNYLNVYWFYTRAFLQKPFSKGCSRVLEMVLWLARGSKPSQFYHLETKDP